MYEGFSIASGIVTAVANFIYMASIWNGKTTPMRGSWITWAMLDSVLFIGMLSKGTLNGQMIASTTTSIIIACMSLRWGNPGWSTLEKWCLAILPFGLLLWYVTDNAVWNIANTLTLIAIGCWPTYESMWQDPSRESRLAWTLMLVSSLLMFPAIRIWEFSQAGFAEAAQPIVWLLTQLPVMYLLWVHARR